MDQNEMQREIQRQFQLMLNYCFGMMNDPEKIELARRMDLSLARDFKPNHPGGAIGTKLQMLGKRNV